MREPRDAYIWHMSRVTLFFCSVLPFIIGCQSTLEVDLLFYGGHVHSYGPQTIDATCLVVNQGKVIAIGDEDSLRNIYHSIREENLQGAHIYPGWHDAHAHFASTGKGLREVQLKGLTSWEACFAEIQSYINQNPDSKWIIGRGWDQNLWGGAYPDRQLLDSFFPNRFFYLSRVDGHAALVSGNVLNELKYDGNTEVAGGELVHDTNRPERLTGILIDAAADEAKAILPELSAEEWRKSLLAAQELFIENGVCAITEAGLPLSVIQLIDSMQKEGSLHIKFVAMLNPGSQEFEFAEKNGIYETAQLKVSSFKLYADGALGSRGALLKAPYCDHAGHGLAIHAPHYFDSICERIYKLGFQANTHCIGDSANRLLLETYAKYLKGPNDLRWRIEHAQIVERDDLPYFGNYSIIPSVQPTHATSDMPWAVDRLCMGRMPGAYAYRSLLAQTGVLPLGTDAPVENINPIQTFISAVYRVNEQGQPSGGFQMEEALEKEDALRGMTYWGAYSGFVDHVYGSLEPTMAADFVVYTQDLETTAYSNLVNLLPQSVWIDGKRYAD